MDLWNQVFSADEDFSPGVSEYQPSETSSSENDPETPRKNILFLNNVEIEKILQFNSSIMSQDPVTQESMPCTSSHNIDEIIENVIAQNVDYYHEDEETRLSNPETMHELS